MLNVAVISGRDIILGERAAAVQPHEGFTDLIWTGVSLSSCILKTASTFVAPISGFRSIVVFSLDQSGLRRGRE